MLNNFKNYLFQKRARKFLSKMPRERRFASYEKAKNVLILFESDFSEKNPLVRKMLKTLKQDGKKVSAWGFIDKKVITTSILPDFRVLNYKQTDLSERPDAAIIRELEGLEFDLMIDLSLKPILPLQYLAVHANASCKAGILRSDLPIYDFILDVESVLTSDEFVEESMDEKYLFNQIIFYLKSIQTKD